MLYIVNYHYPNSTEDTNGTVRWPYNTSVIDHTDWDLGLFRSSILIVILLARVGRVNSFSATESIKSVKETYEI